ncbi:MAG: HEAT repeat domain-containing protein [Candidatus Eisenbacteria bacterium]|nr:HEAT repeat domain-containing protein [Candidatus Eisenbacteria bacterium]
MADQSGLNIEHGFEIIPGGAGRCGAGDETPAPDNEARLVAAAELRPVIEFTRTLAKAVKAARMYPANNPIYARFQTDLQEKIGTCFADSSGIRLVIGHNRLFCQGECVYESADPDDNLARLFFRDGIRELTFHNGIDRAEMSRFLDMVRATSARESTEDLVTQLWDDSLPHITYIAIDDILDQGMGDEPVPAEFGSDFMNYVDFETDFNELNDDGVPEAAREEALTRAGEFHRQLMESGDRQILALSEEEEAILRTEVEFEDQAGLVLRVLDTFFDVIEQDNDPSTRGVIIAVLEKALVSLVAQRQWMAAGHILRAISAVLERRPDLVEMHGQAIDAILKAATDGPRREALCEALNRTIVSPLESEVAYLSAIRPDGVPALCELLGSVESRRGRMAVVNTLVRIGQGNLEALLDHLRDERWYVVRNILLVLGRMKATVAVRHIRPLVTHEDLNVRREALAALSQIGEGEALDALLALLRDTDPRIRVSAARSLSRLGKRAVNPLLQIILSNDFESRPLEERRGFFESLGRTNSPDVLPFLKMLLGKKPIFRKKEAEEMRVCAVEALARMRGPQVKALFDLALSDPSSIVRAAVAGAQKRHDDEEPDDV